MFKHAKKHLKKMGFTNRMAMYLIMFLAVGLLFGFILAVMSIEHDYVGSLLCYTVVFTPIGTAIGIVLGKVVDKSRDENTSANGDGINYARAMANGFAQEQDIPTI